MKQMQGNIVIILLLGSGILLIVLASSPPQEKDSTRVQDTVYTYRANVLPLLQANCNPCHFPGGKVYKKLPFDDSVTVTRLGKKLDTRLKKKEQQAIINGWIGSQQKKY